MLKVLLVLIVTALYLTPLYPVFAVTATNPAEIRKQNLEERKANTQARIDDKKEMVREKVATREAALKAKLARFRDKTKANVVERINNNLLTVNKNMSERMLKHLDKMTDILNRAENKLATSTGEKTAAQNSITDARSKVSTARTAVVAQQNKEYTVEVTSEATVKNDVKVMRDLLHTDLKLVHDLVVVARQSVSTAVNAVARSFGGATNGQ